MHQFKINKSNLSSVFLFLYACHPTLVSFHPSNFLRPRAMPLIKLWSPDEETVNGTTKHTMTIRIMLEDSEEGRGGDDPVFLPNINTAILRKGSSGQHPPQGCPARLWMVRTQRSEPRPSASPGGPRIPNTEQGRLLDLFCPQTTQTSKVDARCETVRNNRMERILEDAVPDAVTPQRRGAQGEELFLMLW